MVFVISKKFGPDFLVGTQRFLQRFAIGHDFEGNDGLIRRGADLGLGIDGNGFG